MRSKLRRALPVLVLVLGLYWIALFIGTHIRLPAALFGILRYDKLLHATAFAGLTYLLGGVLTIWMGHQSKLLSAVWLLAIVYGAVDEYTQQFIPGRTADRFDVLADGIGATIGIAAVYTSVAMWRAWRATGHRRPSPSLSIDVAHPSWPAYSQSR